MVELLTCGSDRVNFSSPFIFVGGFQKHCGGRCVVRVAFSVLDMALFSSSFYFLRFWLGFEDGLGSHGLSRRRSCRI